jgi:hypothetical protein
MTVAEFEHLTAVEAESLLLRRLNVFVDAGAAPCAALVLAAHVEVPEQTAVQLLEQGLSVDLALRLLYEAA